MMAVVALFATHQLWSLALVTRQHFARGDCTACVSCPRSLLRDGLLQVTSHRNRPVGDERTLCKSVRIASAIDLRTLLTLGKFSDRPAVPLIGRKFVVKALPKQFARSAISSVYSGGHCMLDTLYILHIPSHFCSSSRSHARRRLARGS
ncbi:uncharacterized protein LAESUDRAFT_476298 [Laetiporus sulphureus 93-53]|uniref:Secreted protein n=1 Tax=Laetiporus sulphureus 93-53 TaxID=1314785 RepID=A0A165GDI2_9APHY|nr:uncharacterized protein LAESUDRAFT_476298 [Laetiporus sulphureus 93-53]KZT10197.1 hypothetical protein LAESUDRAFT_476298 [Laetiporus sulphureus 93-53]